MPIENAQPLVVAAQGQHILGVEFFVDEQTHRVRARRSPGGGRARAEPAGEADMAIPLKPRAKTSQGGVI